MSKANTPVHKNAVVLPRLSVPLDEFTDGKVYDKANQNIGRTVDNIDTSPDDLFGSASLFNPTPEQVGYIEFFPELRLPPLPLTVCLWYKTHAITPTTQIIFDNDQLQVRLSNGILECELFQPGNTLLSSQTPLNQDNWHHLALTIEPQTLSFALFVNGNKVDSQQLTSLVQATSTSPRAIRLGAGENAGPNTQISAQNNTLNDSGYFKGQLAGFNLFEEVLSTAAIKTAMEQDKTALAVFKQTNPIATRFIDDEVVNVLYISHDSNLNTLSWELINTSGQALTIKSKAGEEPTPSNYHFALTFKANTFSDAEVPQIIDSPSGWKAKSFNNLGERNELMLCVLYTGESDLSMSPSGRLDLPLNYISANAEVGSRTTQVALSYHNLNYVSDPTVIEGSRLLPVNIVNQTGKRDLPLSLSILGSNQILNDATSDQPSDGTASEVKIVLTNIMRQSALNPDQNRIKFISGNPDVEKNTRFTLTFDSADSDFALASKDQLNAITATLTYRVYNEETEQWDIHTLDLSKNDTGSQVEFYFYAPIEFLAAEERLNITLSNIRTNKKSGYTNLYIHYEDIPGYWDGRYTVQVEKTPIVHKEISGNRNVGIGTAPNELYRLSINGNMINNGNAQINGDSKFTGNTLITGSLGIGTDTPSAQLEVAGTIKGDVFSGKGIVPIGTVIDWYRPSLSVPIPAGWMIANGASISSNDTSVDISLRGKTLPNLTGRFVRGQTSSSFYGVNYGGDDSHRHYNNFRTNSEGKHNHNWLWYSGKTISTYNSSGSRFGVINWENGHDTGGSGYYSYTWGSFHDGYTDNESDHYHTVQGYTPFSNNIPRYVGLLKLIRVL